MALPDLDPAQRELALERAKAARRMRAELKQMLKSGEVQLAELLDRAQQVDALAKMRVAEVLEAMPAYGKVKARRLMDRLGIAPTRRLRGLGSNQREALLAHFAARLRGEPDPVGDVEPGDDHPDAAPDAPGQGDDRQQASSEGAE